jgi:hypothetical protein
VIAIDARKPVGGVMGATSPLGLATSLFRISSSPSRSRIRRRATARGTPQLRTARPAEWLAPRQASGASGGRIEARNGCVPSFLEGGQARGERAGDPAANSGHPNRRRPVRSDDKPHRIYVAVNRRIPKCDSHVAPFIYVFGRAKRERLVERKGRSKIDVQRAKAMRTAALQTPNRPRS